MEIYSENCFRHTLQGQKLLKRNFLMISKISFNKRYLLHTYICYTPIATFQKAGTCIDAQQSMAKQPISGCVSNQSHVRKKRERKI